MPLILLCQGGRLTNVFELLCEYEDKTEFTVEQFGTEFGGMSILDIPKLIVLDYEEILAFINGRLVGVACPLYEIYEDEGM